MDSTRVRSIVPAFWRRSVCIASWLASVALVACTAQPQLHAAADRCMASCAQPSPDGDSCLVWAALVPSACVSRHTAVSACCGPGDRPLCTLPAPLSMGSPCICRGADRQGAFVVQGSACNAQ
jgi:hypothetical protein